MKLKVNRFLFACLIITGITLNACGGTSSQPINPTPSPTLATSTPVPAISTLTVTPTLAITPVLTPTDWFFAMLTTTPTTYPLPTLSPDCGTVKLGEAGTQTIDNSRGILVQGTAILCGQIYFPVVGNSETISVSEGLIDLDAGVFSPALADIQFYPGAGSMIFYGFMNVNDTSIKIYGLTSEELSLPTFEDCTSISKSYNSTNDNEPAYACVITNLGNVSRVKVERYNPLDNEMSLEISFVTWKRQ